MTRFLLLAILVFLKPIVTNAQQRVAWQDGKRNLIQFSGVVVEGESLKPISYTSVLIRNSKRGTISDYFGYFSFVAQ